MEQVEDQVHLTITEVTQLLDQVTQSITDDLLSDVMKLDEYSTQPLLPTQTYATIGCGIVIWDAANHLIDANEAAQRILGMTFYELQQHLTTHPDGVFLYADGSPLPLEKQCSTLAWQTGVAHYNVLEGFIRPDGKCCWLQIDALPVKDMEGVVIGVVASFMDVTTHVAGGKPTQLEERLLDECKRLETALQNSEKHLSRNWQIYEALSEQATDLVLITSLDGTYKYVSPSHKRIMGYDPETLLNKNVFTFIHPEDRKQVIAAFTLAYRDPEIVAKTAFRFPHANGTWLTLECTGRNCLQDPAVQGFIVNARDITDQIKLEEKLRHQALHDALTDLPNRTSLQKRLDQALVNAERQHNCVALLMMDLDRFREINDTFGHQHGDLLLQQVSVRLVQAIGGAGVVFRLGGDEFAILLPKADEESTGIISEQLRIILEDPFIIAGYPLNVEASVGVVLYPLHGTDGLTLMRRADVAMYAAKSNHDGVAFYKATHDDQYSQHRLTLIGALRQAIPANELTLYYQPKVNLKTGLTTSVEALARWQHPLHGFVPPDQFIPLAEQTGLINALTAWALETAVRQCSIWLHAGLNLSIAVNLSAWNLRDISLPETILSLLTRYAVPSNLLRVELTESAVMTDTDRASDVLNRLSALGIHISVDDFGTGYSSLAYLKRLPIDELKIDRSFVQHMLEVETDATIVRSTIMLAHNLGLHIVAEGIEDEAILHLLADFDCDFAQGYYLSRPISAVELERWLRQRSSSTNANPSLLHVAPPS